MTLFRLPRELDPVSGLLTLQRELERMFDQPAGLDFGPSGRGVFPAVNVFSDDYGCVVRMEVPGVAPDSLHVESAGRTLTISGTREQPNTEGGSYHRRERSFGRFSRSLQLPTDLQLDQAHADYKHGVLTVRVPKRAEVRPRQIAVQTA